LRASIDARRRRRGGGFTLVELLLALGILGIILTTLIYMRLEAMERVTTTVEERGLRRLAQEKLEENIARCMTTSLRTKSMMSIRCIVKRQPWQNRANASKAWMR